MSALATPGSAQPPREMVLASAGAGKTYRITSRLVALLVHGAEPEQLLASSFTRKAANEILQRTLERLAEAATKPEKAAELSDAAVLEGAPPLPVTCEYWQAVLEGLVRKLHRLNIGTLDSFFIRAAGAFEHELELPPGWGITDEPGANRLRSSALQQVMTELDRDELVELLRLANGGTVRRSIHDHLLGELERLLTVHWQLDPEAEDAWTAFGRNATASGPSAGERARWAEELKQFPIPQTQQKKPNTTWAKAIDALIGIVEAGDWDALVQHGLCQKILTGEENYAKKPVADVHSFLQPALDVAREALRSRYGGQVQALGELVTRFETALSEKQRSTGRFRFEDITRMIGGPDALSARPDLFYRLDGRTQHVLLDEFQDTSLPQWEALEPLVGEVLMGEGRAGVIVADPKQSIYGWRGAEPSIVRRVGAQFSLGSAELLESYRSSEIVLNLVNKVFADLAGRPALRRKAVCTVTAKAWQEDFAEHAAAKKLPGYTTVRLGAKATLFAEAADLVKELHEQAPARTIGVLVRTNAAVAQMILELRKRELFPSEEGGNPLTDSGACEAVLALLRMADHPGDTIARYHVAKTFLGAALDFTDPGDHARAAWVSRAVRQHLLELGYGGWLNEIARRLAPSCDERELRRLLQMVELGYRYDASSTLRPGDFIRLVESQRVEDPSRAAIRVMTVHQSKGLEFATVVLPQLDTDLYRSPRAPVFPWRPEPGERIHKVMPAIPSALRCLFPDVEEAYGQLEAAAIRDGLSTLYVALTRAKHALHLLLAGDAKNSVTPALLVREALGVTDTEAAQPKIGDILYEDGTADWYTGLEMPSVLQSAAAVSEPQEIRLRHEPRTRNLPRRPPSQMEGGSRVQLDVLLRLEHGAAMSRGSIVHAWFEQITWLEEPIPPTEILREIAFEIDPRLDRGILDELVAGFRLWLTFEPVRAALGRSRYAEGAEVRNEYRFLHRENGRVVEGSIDRLVLVRENGGVVGAEVLDYKTDAINGDAEVLAARAEHYRPQMLAYMRAVSSIYGLATGAVTGRLLFLDGPHIIEAAAAPEAAPLPPTT